MKGYALPKSIKPSGPASWCQGIGWVEAKPAKDLQVGEERVYNYGYRYVILSVVNDGKWVTIELDHNGNKYTERKRPNTLIPFQKSYKAITEEVRQNLIKGAQ